MKRYQKVNLVVGAGLSGAVIANLIANELNEETIVIDSRPHIGGNCFDYKAKNGIIVQKYGAHIFHSDNKYAWDFLRKYSEMYPYFHRVGCVVCGKIITLPFGLKAVECLFPQYIANKITASLIEHYGFGSYVPIFKLGESKDKLLVFLYNFILENVFINYTKKQWGSDFYEIDREVISRVPITISYNDCYFKNKYQGMPINGYTSLIEKMLDHNRIKVQLNTEFGDVDDKISFHKIYYSGSLDELFNFKFGNLPFRSLTFKDRDIKKCNFQKHAVVNYPNNFDFTRIIEYKHFYPAESKQTIITEEYPQDFVYGENLPFYPIRNKKSNELYEKYAKETMSIYPNMYPMGRLGLFKYLDMDKAIEASFEIFNYSIKC